MLHQKEKFAADDGFFVLGIFVWLLNFFLKKDDFSFCHDCSLYGMGVKSLLPISSDISNLNEQNNPQEESIKKWKRVAIRDASSFFIPINSRKLGIRELRMKGYSERAQIILKREKKGEISKKLLQLKYDLISVYCTDMIKDFTLFSLRIVFSYLIINNNFFSNTLVY
jgi:hypothetical protein